MKPRFTSASVTQVQPVESAEAVGLRYVSDSEPGIRRVRAGGGFNYVDRQGKTIRDETTLRRIRALAIPPAWADVWICACGNGHLQATGRDARKRKQHRYHPLWREVRDATKYDRMIDFGNALPRIRQRVARDLRKPGLSRERVLATLIKLMDLTFIRVGNDEYAKQNHSYGLTTMKDQHATVRGERVEFSFRGKSGKHHNIAVEDRRLARMVKRCQEIPGQQLFQYYSEDGKRRDVTSGDVNDYLREISGTDFTAKDFRTWAGTVLTAQALAARPSFNTQRQAKRNLTEAITAVAEKLGNTPAVCRKCYIHPFVLDGYAKKKLACEAMSAPPDGGRVIKSSSRPAASLGCDEKAVLRFLRCCRRDELAQARKMAPKLARIPAAWQPRPPLPQRTKAGRR